jgi:alpha-glucosidase
MRSEYVNMFNKYPHPMNYNFADGYHGGVLRIAGHPYELHTTEAGADIHHVGVSRHQSRPGGIRNERRRRLDRPETGDKRLTRLEISESAAMRLTSADGKTLLKAEAGGWLGISGKRWLFRFKGRPEMQFYGLGEKHTAFERSGRAYWFWNTDVWADHPLESVRDGDYDPDYLSVPYLIIKHDNTYTGLLVDSSFPAMISVGAPSVVAGVVEPSRKRAPEILLAAEGGPPSLFLLFGPTLAELTRKFQMLTGPTPLPPIWSLGYHQSRWGYRGASDLTTLADRFERHRLPADGLWLDIDYMAGYRVFTIDSEHMPQPVETISELRERGFRTVPILDPGIKREEGYGVYDSGKAANVFCLNAAGGVFTGLVWPGMTVFPDFSLPETRLWWAGHARRFFELGFEGAWLDMNDPSTGSVDCRDMRFDNGRLPHEACHNRYALLMARATRDALRAARPDRRPFLLSRSGSTGSQKYCAHWTGDNFSSYRHLRRSIAKSLNLSLSGIPFNGADVGGFGGDCSEALLVDWFKAAFLMPFFRNHTMRGSRRQEPWAYSRRALGIIRRFVRLRYTLLPYLYNLFIDQEEKGEAILRPLFYDFRDKPSLPLGDVDDQFMVGPAILQAPFLREEVRQRTVVLPGHKWLRADTGRWVQGEGLLRVRRQLGTTPLFLREGSLVPFQPGVRTTNSKDLNHIGLLCCLSPGFTGKARLRYRADDGLSFDYRRGRRTRLDVTARTKGRRLHLRVKTLAEGFGPVHLVPFSVNRFTALHLETDGWEQRLHPIKERVQLAGQPFDWYRWQPALQGSGQEGRPD